MVDTLSLNYLPETGGWPDQIPRLEDGWWPTGGAVDPANDSGLMNWQAQQLAQRTRFLREALAAYVPEKVAGKIKADDIPAIEAALEIVLRIGKSGDTSGNAPPAKQAQQTYALPQDS